MALASNADEHSLYTLWQLVAELSEQLNNNRAATAALQAQAGQLKGQAVHNGTGFALRRFNTDLSKEVFESELERMNAAIIIENQQLQHENKQLNVLLKEYEQTLETVMAKFRSQAHAAQQHELTLTRHYENLLLSRETSTLNAELANSTQISNTLARVSYLVRQALRTHGGEDPEPEPTSYDPVTGEPILPPFQPLKDLSEEMGGGYNSTLTSDRTEWALERECEIARLEKENEELRKLLGIDSGGAAQVGATEEEWSGTDPNEHRRTYHSGGGSFRGGGTGGGTGRGGGKPAGLLGRGGSHMTLTGFGLHRATSMGWRDRGGDDRGDVMLGRQ